MSFILAYARTRMLEYNHYMIDGSFFHEKDKLEHTVLGDAVEF